MKCHLTCQNSYYQEGMKGREGMGREGEGRGELSDSDPGKESLKANPSHKDVHFQCPEGWVILLGCPFSRGQGCNSPYTRSFL